MTPQEHIDKALRILAKKNHDYQADEAVRSDYFPNGPSDIYLLMHIKMTRIKSLLNQPNPSNESLQDSCHDLINYTAFLAAQLDGDLDKDSLPREITEERDFLIRKRITKLLDSDAPPFVTASWEDIFHELEKLTFKYEN